MTPGSSGVAYPKTKIAGWSSSICNHKIYTFKTEASAPPGATSGAIPTAQGCSAQGLGCSLAFMESLIQQQHHSTSSTFFILVWFGVLLGLRSEVSVSILQHHKNPMQRAKSCQVCLHYRHLHSPGRLLRLGSDRQA